MVGYVASEIIVKDLILDGLYQRVMEDKVDAVRIRGTETVVGVVYTRKVLDSSFLRIEHRLGEDLVAFLIVLEVEVTCCEHRVLTHHILEAINNDLGLPFTGRRRVQVSIGHKYGLAAHFILEKCPRADSVKGRSFKLTGNVGSV